MGEIKEGESTVEKSGNLSIEQKTLLEGEAGALQLHNVHDLHVIRRQSVIVTLD